MNLLKEEVIAIVGPQTSVVSHFVSHMGTATRVPLVSFSATDPSLSEDQYPYFVRLTHSDTVQMAAIAGTYNSSSSSFWVTAYVMKFCPRKGMLPLKGAHVFYLGHGQIQPPYIMKAMIWCFVIENH